MRFEVVVLLAAPLLLTLLDGAREWRWRERLISLDAEVARTCRGLDIAVVATGFFDFDRRLVLHGTFTDQSIEVNDETPLVRSGDTVFVPVFHPLATGCAVIALDGRSGRQLWCTRLLGRELDGNDKYWNHVQLELTDGILVVRGYEMDGRYIERLDASTGRRISLEEIE